MSLSLSVCPSVRSHFVKFEAFSAFEARCFEGVTRVFQGCLLEGSRVFQGSFSEESSKGVQVRWKGISSSCKGVSMVFKRSSMGVSGKSQRCFKEVSKKCTFDY